MLQHILRDWVASYLVCGTSSCSNELVLATRCHLNKINHVLFPLSVLRWLSFLIPSLKKINMSSCPVVRLSLRFAWGLLGACHRDSSLAVHSPLWLETLLEVVPSLYKSSSGFTTWVGFSLLSCAASRLITARDKLCLAAFSHACWRDPTCGTNW